jgi:glycosyltransferase involved in cell wall biosynthesis
MRLLHVSSSYPLLPGGHDVAPFMEEMLAALADSGHEVTVLVPRVDGLVEGQREGVEVVAAGYAPRKLQVWGRGRSLTSTHKLRLSALAVAPFALTSMAIALRRTIAKIRPDLVHLHWVIPQGLLIGVVPKTIPIVVSAHGADARFVQGPLGPLANKALRRADSVVAASSEILDLMASVEASTRGKAVVIPHGASSDVFAPADKKQARSELGIDADIPVVVAVGRLVKKKGFGPLIEAMSTLDDAHLYIVGDGPQRPELESLAASSANENVHLVGLTARATVAKWLAASDVVALPSVPQRGDVDSGPVVLMEAFASGRPVVATPVGMAPDVIKNDVNGYILEHGRPPDIAQAIQMAIEKTDTLGSGARRTFEAVGDWNRVARELQALYESVVTSSKNSSND